MKKKLGDINHKLVQVALSDKTFNLEKFLKFFEKYTIRELRLELDDTQERLKKQRI
jgi:hypothetical protein